MLGNLTPVVRALLLANLAVFAGQALLGLTPSPAGSSGPCTATPSMAVCRSGRGSC